MRPTKSPIANQQWLLPREHGAYGQLGFPLVCALALGRIQSTALLLVVSIVALFVAHEPLLVLRGERGRRRLGAEGMRARWQLAMWLGLAGSAGLTALALSPSTVSQAAALPATLGLAVTVLLVRREEKTTLGEVLVALALATTSLPVAAANGADSRSALSVALIWGAVSSVHVLVVRGLLARGRTDGSARYAARVTGLAVLGFALAAFAVARDALSWVALVAIVPATVVACVFFVWPPSLRKLKTIGWTLMGSSAVTLVVLTALGRT